MIIKGRLVETGEAVAITAAHGVITELAAIAGENEHLPWLSPGWVDLQVNGFGGYDLNGETTTVSDVEGVTEALHKHGVTTYLPTVITGHFDRMQQAFAVIEAYRSAGRKGSKSIAGIHMEGPYLSGEDGSRGAHPREHIRNPDWEEFQKLQEAAGGLITMMTLAPEREGAVPFIRKLASEGIVVAIGHTMATGEQIAQAVDAGATLCTHLGNGSQPMLPRHPNYIWHQLAEDRLWATFIPDGHHLAPPVLKAMLRAKGKRSILVSDCTQFGGMAPGVYDSLIGGKVELTADGHLHTVNNPNILAGSAAALDLGIANAVRYTDMTLAEAVEASTLRPSQVMNDPSIGRLAVDGAATFTRFNYSGQDGQITVLDTIVAGETVYSQA
ncbi:N-acetylglucosamine-6-phosphate deacetylase [Paenibacillaceae bacterium]|nr:N-acetylglucosamine-6-phosphate deacetylase [Paenibacillaceae bacterium]